MTNRDLHGEQGVLVLTTEWVGGGEGQRPLSCTSYRY